MTCGLVQFGWMVKVNRMAKDASWSQPTFQRGKGSGSNTAEGQSGSMGSTTQSSPGFWSSGSECGLKPELTG